MGESEDSGEDGYGNRAPLTKIAPNGPIPVPDGVGGSSTHHSLRICTNLDPAENMAESLTGCLVGSVYSNFLCPHFTELILYSTCPGATITMILDIFAQLPICNVAAPHAIFRILTNWNSVDLLRKNYTK